MNLRDIDARVFNELDAKLVKQKASPSRRNFLVVVRSVLRAFVAEGSLATMPVLPRLPKVGRSVVHAFPAEALPRLLATAGRQLDSLLLSRRTQAFGLAKCEG